MQYNSINQEVRIVMRKMYSIMLNTISLSVMQNNLKRKGKTPKVTYG
jgi:hypothetical protein